MRDVLAILIMRGLKFLANFNVAKENLCKFKGEAVIDCQNFGLLRRSGILVIPNFLDSVTCHLALNEIETFYQNDSRRDRSNPDYRIYNSELILDCGRKFFSNERLLEIGTNYIGTRMINKSCLANRVQAGPSDSGSGGGWHRDSNFPQFKALVYLSDVETSQNGAFQYIRDSHKFKNFVRDTILKRRNTSMTRWDDTDIGKVYGSNQIMSVLGAAGTLVLFDTCLIHRGAPNSNLMNSNRYALTNYYYSKFAKFGNF